MKKILYVILLATVKWNELELYDSNLYERKNITTFIEQLSLNYHTSQ